MDESPPLIRTGPSHLTGVSHLLFLFPGWNPYFLEPTSFSLSLYSTVFCGAHPQAIIQNMQNSAPPSSTPRLRSTWPPQLQSPSGSHSSRQLAPLSLLRGGAWQKEEATQAGRFLSSRASQLPACGRHLSSAVI